jgi:hypothetical protein
VQIGHGRCSPQGWRKAALIAANTPLSKEKDEAVAPVGCQRGVRVRPQLPSDWIISA